MSEAVYRAAAEQDLQQLWQKNIARHPNDSPPEKEQVIMDAFGHFAVLRDE